MPGRALRHRSCPNLPSAVAVAAADAALDWELTTLAVHGSPAGPARAQRPQFSESDRPAAQPHFDRLGVSVLVDVQLLVAGEMRFHHAQARVFQIRLSERLLSWRPPALSRRRGRAQPVSTALNLNLKLKFRAASLTGMPVTVRQICVCLDAGPGRHCDFLLPTLKTKNCL